ncbi:ADP-ribosylglycohydrolase family protein [Sulfurospirillum arcachonense]|uniref:ADP-ribosylglycohydrolase family protein n=1 Tax=Sulfurospirillum arcachonense TaxID=57666 RepID=UPI000468AA42|nr:ADP-ribosylglycohydrolase family protein [Sulfurospirillum arcachonense]
MFSKEKIKEIVTISLIADSYSLGAHWVYDEEQLKNLDIDWEKLNAPQAMWHKGKSAGDFTHIGDQAYWLYQFLQDKETFYPLEYLTFWKEKMSDYEGYIDGATRETLENIDNGKLSGSNSDDFSVIGRMFSLLLVSKTEEDFLKNVKKFIKLSHDNEKVIEVALFFAKLLLHVKDSKNIEMSMRTLSEHFSEYVKQSVKEGIDSKDKDSFTTIRNFGPACGIDEGFRGIIHLLVKYPDDLKELLMQNAKAGGDSSSRSMIASSILTAIKTQESLPKDWYKINL